MTLVPLVRILTDSGYGSRRAVVRLIDEGRVEVNGRPATAYTEKVDPAVDAINVNGVHVTRASSRRVYLMLNKPEGYLSTTEDDRDRPTVLDLLPEHVRTAGLHPAGRLDEDSTGLLVLTNDGQLTYQLTHPRFEHEKEYWVATTGRLTDADVERLEQGVEVDGQVTWPARVKILVGQSPYTYSVTIHEGRKRQVRMMFAAIGQQVALLKRVRMGGLLLSALPEGEWRELTADDLRDLMRTRPVARSTRGLPEATRRALQPRTRAARSSPALQPSLSDRVQPSRTPPPAGARAASRTAEPGHRDIRVRQAPRHDLPAASRSSRGASVPAARPAPARLRDDPRAMPDTMGERRSSYVRAPDRPRQSDHSDAARDVRSADSGRRGSGLRQTRPAERYASRPTHTRPTADGSSATGRRSQRLPLPPRGDSSTAPDRTGRHPTRAKFDDTRGARSNAARSGGHHNSPTATRRSAAQHSRATDLRFKEPSAMSGPKRRSRIVAEGVSYREPGAPQRSAAKPFRSGAGVRTAPQGSGRSQHTETRRRPPASPVSSDGAVSRPPRPRAPRHGETPRRTSPQAERRHRGERH